MRDVAIACPKALRSTADRCLFHSHGRTSGIYLLTCKSDPIPGRSYALLGELPIAVVRRSRGFAEGLVVDPPLCGARVYQFLTLLDTLYTHGSTSIQIPSRYLGILRAGIAINSAYQLQRSRIF